jgi:hypothetical protein
VLPLEFVAGMSYISNALVSARTFQLHRYGVTKTDHYALGEEKVLTGPSKSALLGHAARFILFS